MSDGTRIFDAVLREDESVSRHSESIATFLNRVAGDYWDQVRALIERWASEYPAHAKPDLFGRLRSADNRQWIGAFWELYLHESLRRSNYDVEVHPKVPDASGKPDFLARRPDSEFYVEAKSVFGKSNVGEEARLKTVFDAVNLIRSPNFFLHLHVNRVGAQAPATKKMRVAVETWLASLDPDALDPAAYLPGGEKPHIWATADWELEFRPFPIRSEFRGRVGNRPLGMWSLGDAQVTGSQLSLANAIKEKGHAYGKLDRPLVLALNLDTGFDRTFETMNALYGDAMVVFNAADPNGAQDTRQTNGYFGYPDRWRHRSIAGVLIGPNILPWTVASVAPTMWMHPSPVERVAPLRNWHQSALDGAEVTTSPPEVEPHEPFDLPAAWPVGDPFPHG